MKKIITILFLFFVLGLLGEASFAQENIEEETNTETKNDDYQFPLDSIESNFSIYDYDYKRLSGEDLQEASIEKSSSTEEDEAALSRNLKLFSDTVDFYPETSQYVAKNNAKLIIEEEKLQLTANEIIVDQRSYEIIGIGNVKIVKNGIEYFGDYIKINTKKESSFFSNPILYYPEIVVNATSATMHADETIAKKGSAILKKNKSLLFSTSKFGSVQSERFFDMEKSFDTDKNNYKIKAKKIIVKREHDRTDIVMKKAWIYRAGAKIAYSPNLIIATDKDVNYVETSLPEIGKKEQIGTYIAPSFVAPLPNASTLKLGPLVSLDSHSNVGLGGFARLYTPKSRTEAFYSSNTNKFVLDGEYDITNDWKLRYTQNDYMRSGWMGGQMPDYGIDLTHEKLYDIPQANFSYRNWLSFGFFKDTTIYSHKKPLRTFRYRWQGDGQNRAPLLAWEKYLMLGYVYQHDFSLYQTGETTGVIRVGPRLYSDLGRLNLETSYFISGQHGHSPFIFDQYRYGHHNVRFRGQYYVNKYLALAYLASMNIGEKDYRGEWLTENQLIVAVGTEDLKFRLGWDTVRNTAHLGMDLFLGTNKSLLEFEEMHVEKFEPAKSKKKKKEQKKETKL